jgi:multidrug resistance efflux pump
MTWLRKTRPVLIVVGLALAVGSLVGARARSHGDGGESAAKAAEPGAPKAAGGPIIQSGTITKVLVNEGDAVKVDQELYEFDATTQAADLTQAGANVAVYKVKVKEAEQAVKEYGEQIKLAELTVTFAKRKVELAVAYHTLVDKNLEKGFRAQGVKAEDWEDLKKSNPDLYKAKVEWTLALNDLDLAERKLAQLKEIDPQVKADEARAGVTSAEAARAKAQSAVNLCVVRAKTAGTVEHLSIGPGSTLGIGTHAPALLIVPAGPRIVRAEVEAEFAHRVGPELEGKGVTIIDGTDANLTYSGTVRRVATAFLTKRSNADGFLGNDTRVLEVRIEVADAAPAGKPPLFVGKRVRVNLGR